MNKAFRLLAAVALMAAFFFAGVRFCILAQHIEVVGHNDDDYVYTVEIFGQEEFGFAEWSPLPVTKTICVDARQCAA